MEGVCVYCGGERRQMSSEHYLPAALGAFGEFQILHGRVCTGCNSAIGESVETPFLRAGPIAFFRWILGIEGRSGRPPNPFYKAHGAPAILVYGEAPNFGFEMLWEVEWATRNVTPARQLILLDPVRGRVPLLITDRILKDAAALRAALADAGLLHARPEHAWGAEPDECDRIDALVRGLWGEPPPNLWHDTVLPAGQTIPLKAIVQVGSSFFRAVAKVVFHYALKVLPDLDGASDQLAPIRDYVLAGRGTGLVRELPEQVIGNFQLGQRPRQWSHILAVERNNERIFGYAQFFVGPEALPFPLRVDICRNPARVLRPRPERQSHMFAIETIDGGGRPHGSVEDLSPMEALVLPWSPR